MNAASKAKLTPKNLPGSTSIFRKPHFIKDWIKLGQTDFEPKFKDNYDLTWTILYLLSGTYDEEFFGSAENHLKSGDDGNPNAVYMLSACLQMTLAKPVIANVNFTYQTKRLAAMRASCPGVGVAADDSIVKLAATMFNKHIKPNLKHTAGAVMAILESLRTTSTNTVVNELRKQVDLVWAGSGMKAAELMRAMIIENQSMALALEVVAKEAIAFTSAYDELQKKEGTNFPYLGVQRSPALSAIAHAKYPSLYVAATAWAKEKGLVNTNFKVSTFPCNHSEIIHKAIKRKQPGAEVDLIASESDLEALGIKLDRKALMEIEAELTTNFF